MGTTRLVAAEDALNVAPFLPSLTRFGKNQHYFNCLFLWRKRKQIKQPTMKWTLLVLMLVGAAIVVAAIDDESDDLLGQEDEAVSSSSSNEDDDVDDPEDDAVVRVARGAPEGKKGNKVCRYTKGAWSECDAATNQRTRSLSLKKGDTATCQPSKTITKKCKKAGAGRRNRKN